ncbi:MAG: sodium ion-translocating decarboxylase subunit beta, partial [Clostridiales bacterium]|nr:sodium ion-translocating decarboxylase subunit beta [Clostridiales bacterium]
MDLSGILGNLFSGVSYLFTAEGLKTLVMFVIAGTLIYLAIRKDYEPA